VVIHSKNKNKTPKHLSTLKTITFIANYSLQNVPFKHLFTLKTITFIANYSMQNVPFKFAGDFD
jgi:hypothetical protein